MGRPDDLQARAGRSAEPTVSVHDERADPMADTECYHDLAVAALLSQGVAGPCELSVTFVDPDEMAELNRRHMHAEGPTDVLSFPIDGDATIGPGAHGGTDDPPPLLLGDVVICPAVAATNAPDHAGSYDDEIALLIVHGILHLLGHDHADPDESAVMQARERELLDRFHGPLAGDPWGS